MTRKCEAGRWNIRYPIDSFSSSLSIFFFPFSLLVICTLLIQRPRKKDKLSTLKRARSKLFHLFSFCNFWHRSLLEELARNRTIMGRPLHGKRFVAVVSFILYFYTSQSLFFCSAIQLLSIRIFISILIGLRVCIPITAYPLTFFLSELNNNIQDKRKPVILLMPIKPL